MKKILYGILLVFLAIHQGVFAQNRVLVYSETNGFRHTGAINGAREMIRSLGTTSREWATDVSDDSSVFNTENLQNYRVVIWANTSGDGLLEDDERAAFESYIADGGGFVGIHAATDTYRDGSWPFYNELVGAIVRTDPNHTANNFNADMTVQEANHPTVSFLNNRWNKNEEFYYWNGNGGRLYDSNNIVLTVESTGNQPYDEERPISWYKEFGGGRSFYTALGHNGGDYTDNPNFIKHVEEAIKWAGGFDETNPPGPPAPPESQLIDDGQYVIKNPELNEVITSSMQSSNNAAMEVVISNDASQIWDFVHLGENVYTIRNMDTNRYLEVPTDPRAPRASCINGANVATWINANSNHQKFKIEEIESNYVLRPQHCLQTTVQRSGGVVGANVQLSSESNQAWEIINSTQILSTSDFNGTKQNIAIFPNPVKTIFSIAGLSNTTDVLIVDISGKKVLQKRVNPTNGIVDISSLPKGVYFLQSPSKAFSTKRLIKI